MRKKPMVLMVQGTMSNAGKSILVAALCRIFKQDGYRVMPFKSQNMALNSYITEDGAEIGRAQAMQAMAAGEEPTVWMNPILLKPTGDMGSQVIVNGKVLCNMAAKDYFAYKKSLLPMVMEAFERLSEIADVIVIEGAGSPAEINLKENDIVNMGLAELVDAPVLLVGDIDRGGVFAQLYGTCALLEEKERARIGGLIINKFRGDKTILDPGIRMLEEKCHIPVVGCIPYLDVDIEDEDSLGNHLEKKAGNCLLDVVVIRLPRISNFTDFDVLQRLEKRGVGLRYVQHVQELGHPDMVFLPGSKNTIADLKWLRQNGFEAVLHKLHEKHVPIMGICGGFQMLGERICDPYEEEAGGEISGLGLLPVETVFAKEKVTTRVNGYFNKKTDVTIKGYEIHMGETKPVDGCVLQPLLTLTEEKSKIQKQDGFFAEHVYGTYVHGVLDLCGEELMELLAQEKGFSLPGEHMPDMAQYRNEQFELLAKNVRASLNMEAIYQMMESK